MGGRQLCDRPARWVAGRLRPVNVPFRVSGWPGHSERCSRRSQSARKLQSISGWAAAWPLPARASPAPARRVPRGPSALCSVVSLPARPSCDPGTGQPSRHLLSSVPLSILLSVSAGRTSVTCLLANYPSSSRGRNAVCFARYSQRLDQYRHTVNAQSVLLPGGRSESPREPAGKAGSQAASQACGSRSRVAGPAPGAPPRPSCTDAGKSLSRGKRVVSRGPGSAQPSSVRTKVPCTEHLPSPSASSSVTQGRPRGERRARGQTVTWWRVKSD